MFPQLSLKIMFSKFVFIEDKPAHEYYILYIIDLTDYFIIGLDNFSQAIYIINSPLI